RLELLPELATALVESGELAQAKAVAEEAALRARRHGLELVEWRAALVLLSIRVWTAGPNTEVLPETESAAEALERIGDEIGLARAYHLVGLMQFWLGRGAPASESF